MSVARARAPAIAALAAVAACIALAAVVPPSLADSASSLYLAVLVLVTVVGLAALAWLVPPAWTLTGAIFLTPLAGHWPELGVPGALSPDRLLFVAGIAAVILRSPPVADRPRLRIAPVHWLLGLALAYALVSAFFAGTLLQRDPFLKIVDAFGILPFFTFLVAPLAFRTPQERGVLLGALVVLGAYLGLTVLFETIKLDALIWPRYILNAHYGIHVERGRGAFVDAVANGVALYMCAVACGIAAATWRGQGARRLAVGVGLLCLLGTFFTLERSVWIGTALGTFVVMLVTPRLRRYVFPLAITTAVVVVGALTLIPGLSDSVQHRLDAHTLWDRKNLARAAVNMVERRPLFGFGWSRFTSVSSDYFQQADDYPLTATTTGVHNIPLTYAGDLGLIGMTLWGLGVVLGVGGALATRGPPDLEPWRVGLLAVATAYAVVLSAVPPTAWLNRSLWLFAGVVWSGRYAVTSSRVST
jgi:putative inorganic carbon (hco3(-)) transporter